MAYKNKANNLANKASASLSYVDFEPKTELKEEGDVDTLIISLPGFKKEQLRVQVSNTGILKIFGEKPENPQGTIIHRFVKETKLSNDCNINEIRAKFTPNDELRLTMPKRVMTMTAPSSIVQQPHEKAPTTTPAQPKPDITQTSKASDQKQGGLGGSIGKMESVTRRRFEQGKEQMFGDGNILDKLKGRKFSYVGVGLGVAMVVMVGIGAYVAYNYGSATSSLPYTSFTDEYVVSL